MRTDLCRFSYETLNVFIGAVDKGIRTSQLRIRRILFTEKIRHKRTVAIISDTIPKFSELFASKFAVHLHDSKSFFYEDTPPGRNVPND